QLGLQVRVAGDRAQDAAPGGGDVLRGLVRPPDPGEDAFLPRQAPWYVRPAGQAQLGWLDRRPDVDVRMADDEDVGIVADGGGDLALLGPRHQVVDEDTKPPPVLR